MISFEELVLALERYQRRQAGQAEAAQAATPGTRNGVQQSDRSAEIALDEVEDA